MIPIFLQLLDSEDDRDFLVRIYEDYYRLMYRHAFYLLQQDALAEEMVNATFIKLIENISKIRSLDCHVLPSYIVSIVRNLSINCLRRHKRISAREVYGLQQDFVEEMQDLSADTEKQALLRLDIAHMKQAIQKLPENYRDLLSMKYTLHMDDAEIADLLDIKKDSVRQLLRRTRIKALSLLEEGGELYENRT